jgi:hypothetical protein
VISACDLVDFIDNKKVMLRGEREREREREGGRER